MISIWNHFTTLPITILLAALALAMLVGVIPIKLRATKRLYVGRYDRTRQVRYVEAVIISSLSLPVLYLLLYEPPAFLYGYDGVWLLNSNTLLATRMALFWIMLFALSSVLFAAFVSLKWNTSWAVVGLVVVLLIGVKEIDRDSFTSAIRKVSLGVRKPSANPKVPREQLAQWNKELNQLAQHARLNDYKPSPQWADTIFSYGPFAWQHLSSQAIKEPPLNKLLQQSIRERFGIDTAMTADAAWQALERVAADAVAQHFYQSDSFEGHAVEMLVPLLDADTLCDYWRNAINKQQKMDPAFITTNITPSKYFSWSNYRLPIYTKDSDGLRTSVICEAAKLKEETLSQQFPGQPNVFEHELVPELLRKSYRDLNNQALAEVVGGPVWEQFVVRHYRRSVQQGQADLTKTRADQTNEQAAFDFISAQTGFPVTSNKMTSFGAERVNQWYYKRLNLDSAGGQQFRTQHREELLQLAARSLGPIKTTPSDTHPAMPLVLGAILSSLSQGIQNKYFPNHLEFLFLDRTWNENKPSFAMEFWPLYDESIESRPKINQEARLHLRWVYLSRLWPESNVDMFVDAYPSHGIYAHTAGDAVASAMHQCKELPQEARRAVLKRIVEKLTDLPESVNAALVEHALREVKAIEASLVDWDTPENILRWLELYEIRYRKPIGIQIFDGRWEREHGVQSTYALSRGDGSQVQYEQLAQSEIPALRLIVVEAAAAQAYRQRIALLERLLTDADPEVRERAIQVHQELRALETMPLPTIAI